MRTHEPQCCSDSVVPRIPGTPQCCFRGSPKLKPAVLRNFWLYMEKLCGLCGARDGTRVGFMHIS